MSIEALASPAEPGLLLDRPVLQSVPGESGTRVGHDARTLAAQLMVSQALWLAPVLALQLTLILRLDARGPLAAAQAGAAVATLAATGFGYLAIRSWFGQGAALAGAGSFAVSAAALLAAWSTAATAYGVLAAAFALWVVSTRTRSSEPSRGVGLVPMLVAATPLAAAALILAGQGHWQPSARPARGIVIHRELLAIGPLLGAAAIGAVISRRRVLAPVLLACAMVPLAHLVWLGNAGGLHQAMSLSVVALAPLVGVTGMALLRRGRWLGPRVVLAAVCGALLLTTGMTSSDGVVHDRTHPNASATHVHSGGSQRAGSRYAP